MECFYCRWSNDKHNENCPKTATPAQQEAAKATWQAGYDDGRNRREAQSSDPTYVVGWVRGDAAADYRENVFE